MKAFIILAIAAVVSCGRLRREETTAVDMFKDDISKAAEKAKEVGEHITKMLGLDNLPSGDSIIDLIKNQTKAFADKAEVVQKQLENELKNIGDSPIAQEFGELSKKIQETVVSFRQSIESSGMAEKAAELQGKFQEGINALLEESKKVATKLEPQVTETGKELEKVTKKLLDDAVENLSTLEGKIHTATGHTNP